MILICPGLKSVLEAQKLQKLYWENQFVHQVIQGNISFRVLECVLKYKASLTPQR